MSIRLMTKTEMVCFFGRKGRRIVLGLVGHNNKTLGENQKEPVWNHNESNSKG